MYELFAKAQLSQAPLLIQVVHNRMTAENERILNEIWRKECQGRVEARLPGQLERHTVCAIFGKAACTLEHVKTLPEYEDMSVVYVKEEKPPVGRSWRNGFL
ncbi:MAG: hypothetical protein LBH75_01265 [Treponema sp.]|nr:hypothetical protein [Treponema sp.]